jgi:DnaJ-class molecular chaperone
MFQKINEAYETVGDMEKRKVYDMELKGGGGDISELDDILKCFFGGMGGGMHHMQQFSNMGGGGREEVTVRQYTAPHAGDSETAAVWENRIFSCLTKTACYKKRREITFENAYLGCKKTLTLSGFL